MAILMGRQFGIEKRPGECCGGRGEVAVTEFAGWFKNGPGVLGKLGLLLGRDVPAGVGDAGVGEVDVVGFWGWGEALVVG